MKKTTKNVTIKNTSCKGYKIKYDLKGRPTGIRLVSDNGTVDLDDATMIQVMHDWETDPDEDTSFPQRYIFNVEAR